MAKNSLKGRTKTSIFLLLGFFSLLALSSCQSYKNIPYFENVSSDTSTGIYKDGILINITKISDVTIQSGDILNVSIQTIDPDVNTVFNSATSIQSANASANVVANTNAANGNTNSITGYLVDNEGFIELPIAGKIKVTGLTTAEAKEKIRGNAATYYKNPIVNVQIVNFKVTVIGEVLRPGAYLINGERATLLDALGQAGDLTIYGMRTNILLSRRENGKQKMVRFNLTSTDIYDSPYFYLKQGDMVYVQPSKAKANSSDGTLTRTYALISSTLSLIVVLATRNY